MTESQTKTSNDGIDWSDPTIPVGNAPPMARWPMLVTGMAWAAGVAFLVMMAIARLNTSAL